MDIYQVTELSERILMTMVEKSYFIQDRQLDPTVMARRAMELAVAWAAESERIERFHLRK